MRLGRRYTLQEICTLFGISRQAHYQALRREEQRLAQEALVLAEVRAIRQRHPHMGGRKIWHLLHEQGVLAAAAMGRDRLLALLARHDLLVPRKRTRVRTTVPGIWRVPNLLIGLQVTHPLQVVVSDISYWPLVNGGFVYIYVLMDLFSRALVGWHVGATLEATEALQALQRAWQLWGPFPAGWIHHSDHGWQYGSGLYRSFVDTHQGRLSMGRVGSAYDNAYAERVIGTLKREYLLHQPVPSLPVARQWLAEAVRLYNTERPHEALGYATPMDVLQQPEQFSHLAFRLCQEGEFVRRCV